MAHREPSLKISCKSVAKFLRKVADNKQRRRQTSSSAEVQRIREMTLEITHCTILVLFLIFTSPAGAVAKYCDDYACVCVCLSVRQDISGTTRAIFTNFFVHVAYGRGSVLLRNVDDRPHRLSPGSGDGSAQPGP